MMSLILACFFTTPSPVPPPERKEFVIEQIVGLPGKEPEFKFSDRKRRNKTEFEEALFNAQNPLIANAYNRRGNRNH